MSKVCETLHKAAADLGGVSAPSPHRREPWLDHCGIRSAGRTTHLQTSVQPLSGTAPVPVRERDVVLNGHDRTLSTAANPAQTSPTHAVLDLASARSRAASFSLSELCVRSGWRAHLVKPQTPYSYRRSPDSWSRLATSRPPWGSAGPRVRSAHPRRSTSRNGPVKLCTAAGPLYSRSPLPAPLHRLPRRSLPGVTRIPSAKIDPLDHLFHIYFDPIQICVFPHIASLSKKRSLAKKFARWN